MTKMSIQKQEINCMSFDIVKRLSYRMSAVLVSIAITAGCTNLKTVPAIPVPAPRPNTNHKLYQLQNEVKQLEELIEIKDALIKKQSLHQQKQAIYQKNRAKTQQDIRNEVTRVQVMLHRLATKPSAASKIAEVEVAMENIKQNHLTQSDQMLQAHAQQLLNAASVFYEDDNYVVAMNYAAQAHEFINMIADKSRKLPYSSQELVSIHAPIMLEATTDINLRKEPLNNAKILNILKKGSSLIMYGYRGNWLQVQAEGGKQGWVLYNLVETVVSGP